MVYLETTYKATGKKEFLNIMCRYVDHIDKIFGSEKDKISGYPGHQEIPAGNRSAPAFFRHE